MEQQIQMIAAASQVLSYRKKYPEAIHEDIFQHVSDFITSQKIRDSKTKMAMLASASKAFEISRKNPDLNDKQVLNQVMQEIPSILQNIEIE